MPKLDLYEQRIFDEMMTIGIQPENALAVIVNQVEGDESQLSVGLKQYAKKKGLL